MGGRGSGGGRPLAAGCVDACLAAFIAPPSAPPTESTCHILGTIGKSFSLLNLTWLPNAALPQSTHESLDLSLAMRS